MTTDAWGIDQGYEDALGVWRPVPERTRSALLAAMGVSPPDEPRPREGVRVVREGQSFDLPGPAEIHLEDRAILRADDRLPTDLPAGYHDLRLLDRDDTVRLIVTPGPCHLPPAMRVWGWAAQLYAARSRESWGIGDFADLRRLARWSRGLGAGVLLVNPFHSAGPRTPPDPSPYRPSSRRYRNPIYLRIEEIPGAAEVGPELAGLAEAGRGLNAQRRIARETIGRLKSEALGRLWRRFRGHPAFDRYREDEGQPLRTFAIFATLAERHGSGWRHWPDEHRRPEHPAVARFAAEHADRVHFHEWVQWLLDAQLARAAAALPLVHDFPIGVDPDGADAWAWQGVLATDVSVGAPPDRYHARGQDWGLPPFVPHRLRALAYEPFVETIRGALRHAGGLRIDHVMGLFRLFWIPSGLAPADGGYVRYPAEDLLGILALESHRARAFIVGEDLGTVERGVRERLAARRILSYRVVWFETEPPGRYPELSVAAVTTHDLPTIAGVWTGADLDAQRKLGRDPNAEAIVELRRRLCAMSGVPEGGDVSRVIESAYAALARAPSRVVTATLEDALAVAERPNMPGTTTEWPNWSMALPAPLETIETTPLALGIARALGQGRHRLGEGDGPP